MIPTFVQCRPIECLSDIRDCLSKPPEWVNRVVPLKERSKYVCKNIPNDCHQEKHEFQVKARIDSRTAPKTMICHDYKGGYLADSYVPFEGSENKTFATNGYPFYNWAHIDYFVYFSHYFITIPPLAWLNAAHQNGVKILGTLITENKEGEDICNEKLFKYKEQMLEFVYQLTEIQRIFGFDGWLLNIENKVDNPEILRQFVETLTEKTHLQDSESVVIWYDSVTKEGLLQWQNELNEKNKNFFDSCDGIYLNYSWTERQLENTLAAAESRVSDVFVGVDVFGRNMFGGGQLDSHKAAEVIRKYKLSMALFAPGWTHETLEKNANMPEFVQFLNKDDSLWINLWSYLYTHPINHFFQTNFHVGLDFNYYNLYMQKLQLSRILYPEQTGELSTKLCNCLRRSFVQSKNSCLISTEQLPDEHEDFHRLFSCDLKLSGSIVVYLLYKTFLDSSLDLVLFTCLNSGANRQIRLLSREKPYPMNNATLLEVNPLNDKEIAYNQTLNNIAKRFVTLTRVSGNDELSFSMFQFTPTPSVLLEIVASVRNGRRIHLLEFGILPLN
ncbi:hypothetical protein ABEB36_010058 [Hypothenemus hampei]|uniref:Cytosolic endo-beta-N-acetylglucosaminidase TIM barrel domain-containing protein n=1 Tax=Hypothenemus hampei TaxID=57062 RepID=A0ABD1EIC6_HYPHA